MPFSGPRARAPDHFAPALIEFLKPMLLGQNPQDIGAIWWKMWKKNRHRFHQRDRCGRHLPLGH